MKIMVNDQLHEVAEGMALADFIAGQGLKPEGIAVAINYAVVPKKDWPAMVLQEGQEVMIIHAVSGG